MLPFARPPARAPLAAAHPPRRKRRLMHSSTHTVPLQYPRSTPEVLYSTPQYHAVPGSTPAVPLHLHTHRADRCRSPFAAVAPIALCPCGSGGSHGIGSLFYRSAVPMAIVLLYRVRPSASRPGATGRELEYSEYPMLLRYLAYCRWRTLIRGTDDRNKGYG